MKKTVSILMALVFVLSFAFSAFAAPAEIPADTQAVVAKGKTQVTIGGSVRVRGESRNNTNDFNNDVGSNMNYWDQQVRLRIDAEVTKNTTARVVLENGGANASDYVWGTETVEAKGTIPVGNGKQGLLYVLEAWLEHKGSGLLGVPAGLKIGHQPTKLGYGLFLDHTKFGNDAALFYVNPIKELTLALVYSKVTENNTWQEDDHNLYAFAVTYSPDKNTNLSFDVSYVDAQRVTITQNFVTPFYLWNFGLRGDTKIAGFGLKADVEVQTGKAKAQGVNPEIKYSGWAAKIGANYKIDPVTLTLAYGYGSGDDGSNPTKNKQFQTFQSGIWKEDFTYVYEYRTRTSAKSFDKAGFKDNAYISNLHYVTLGAKGNLTKDLNAYLGIFWLRADKAVSIMNPASRPSKDIGWEIDGRINYRIDRNLNYWVEGGYLFAGAAFDPSPTKSSDNAYAIRHGIAVSF